VLGLAQAEARRALAALRRWIQAAPAAGCTGGGGSGGEDDEEASWEAAFLPRPPRQALGARALLHVHPKLAVTAAPAALTAAAGAAAAYDGAGGGGGSGLPCGLLSGAALLAAHAKGPPGLRAKAYRNLTIGDGNTSLLVASKKLVRSSTFFV
jgi:hypothetical protein